MSSWILVRWERPVDFVAGRVFDSCDYLVLSKTWSVEKKRNKFSFIFQMLKHVQISPHRNRSDSLSLRSSTSCASSLCGSPEPPSDSIRTPSRASSYCSLNEAIPQVTFNFRINTSHTANASSNHSNSRQMCVIVSMTFPCRLTTFTLEWMPLMPSKSVCYVKLMVSLLSICCSDTADVSHRWFSKERWGLVDTVRQCLNGS